MRTKIYFPVVMLTALVVLGVLVWREFSATREAERARAVIVASASEEAANRRQVEQRLAAADEARTRAQAALDGLKQKLPVTPAPVRRSGGILELIRNDPEAEAFFLASERADLTAKYGPLIRSLKLTPEAAAKFLDAFIRREEERMDLAAVLPGQGMLSEAGYRQLQDLQVKAEAAYEASQRATLGEAGYRELQDYERTASTRGMVSAIAGVAAVEHAPFTPQQADALVQAIAGASENYRKGYQANHNDADWSAVEVQARAILSPEQFAVFTTMDPGPSRPGLLQTRMYALVAQANRKEMEKAPRSSGK
jgi:hypothetical protein